MSDVIIFPDGCVGTFPPTYLHDADDPSNDDLQIEIQGSAPFLDKLPLPWPEESWQSGKLVNFPAAAPKTNTNASIITINDSCQDTRMERTRE